MFNKLLLTATAALLALFVTGCWDRVEINERGFVIGVAIDTPGSKRSEEIYKKEVKNKPRGTQRFSVTYQFVIPQKLQSSSGSTADTSFMNLTSEGDTMSDIDRQMATRTSRSPYFEHLKVIVISEEIAENSEHIGEVLDFYLRNQEMRRSTKVLVADGEARRILEVTPQNEKLPVMYIQSITQNNLKTARMVPATKLSDLHELVLDRKGFAVQRIIGAVKEAKVVGAAIFRGQDIKMTGTLGPEEAEGLNLLTGKIKGGILKFKANGKMAVFELIDLSSHRLEADVSNLQRIRFTVKLDAIGYISESLAPVDFLDKKKMKELESSVAQEIKRMTGETLKKLQKEYKADAIGLGSFLEQEHYKVWKQISKDWEKKYFSTAEVEVQAKVTIRRNGTVNKTYH